MQARILDREVEPRLSLGNFQIENVGDRCLLVRLGQTPGEEVSQTVHAVADWLQENALTGVLDVVPAFTTVAVHFDPFLFPRESGTAAARLGDAIRNLLADGVPKRMKAARLVEVPACYGGEYGPDLEAVARSCGIDTAEVIRLHSATPLTLYTFYFSPGNPFAGPLHPKLRVPRLSTPRMLVPAGSVAIANDISSIYSTNSPGGWNVIARTPWKLFDLDRHPPTRLELGDQLQFVPISAAEFRTMQEA